jgi:hypothetical protein
MQIYNNQIEIERQSKLTRDQLARLRSNASELSGLIRQVTVALRECGDLGNYFEVCEEKAAAVFKPAR